MGWHSHVAWLFNEFIIWIAMIAMVLTPLLPMMQEVLINVAPKKANWDLRRDIADKLARLERRTQVCVLVISGKLWVQQLSQLSQLASLLLYRMTCMVCGIAAALQSLTEDC